MPAASKPSRRRRQLSHLPQAAPDPHPPGSRTRSGCSRHRARVPSRMMSALLRSISGVCTEKESPSTPALVARLASCSNGFDELRTAVRIPGVVHRVHADEKIGRTEHLRPGECQREKNGVAGRHIGYRYLVRDHPVLRYRDGIGQSAPSRRMPRDRWAPRDARAHPASWRPDRQPQARRDAADRSRTRSRSRHSPAGCAAASTVAESRPPETRTMAFFPVPPSAARLVTPEQLVQLHLEANG